MKTHLVVPWMLLALAALPSAAFAAPDVFFGEDLNPGTDGDSGPPLTVHPNADAARAEFYSRLLNGVLTEDFEDQPTGAVPPFQLAFGEDTAAIEGTAAVEDTFYSGHAPVSGSRYLDIGHDANPKSFRITFSAPQSAFGFYVTDLGDGGAQITIALHHATGPDTEIVPASTVDEVRSQASVIFFGVIDTENPFDAVTISRLPLTETEGYGFDDMVIARAGSVIDVIDSFFLPRSVSHRPNAAAPSRGVFTTAGFFDTGSKSVDLTGPATLTVGGREFDIPGLAAGRDGRTFTYAAGGLSFTIQKNPYGSSRAKFRLKFVGDLGGSVPLDGPLDLRFRNAAVDGLCSVVLAGGRFRILKTRGSLVQPNLFLLRAGATIAGARRDALNVYVGLASGGAVPDQASDVYVEFGRALSAVIPGSQFTRSGDRYVFKGNAGGVTQVVLDYARETILIQGSRLDLGAFPQGQTPLRIVVGLGSDNRGVDVRVGRKGSTLRY